MSQVKLKSSISATTRAELRRVAGVLSQVRGSGRSPANKPVSLKIGTSIGQTPPVEIEVSAETLDQITRLIEEAGAEVKTSSRRQRDELTTQEAAGILGVSRPYLIKLLDAGKIPYRRVGHFRRIRREDLEQFEKAERERRIEVMKELVAETEALGLYS